MESQEQIMEPSVEEIARVEAWQESQRLGRMVRELEKRCDELEPTMGGAAYRGWPIDERLTKKALIGLVRISATKHLCKQDIWEPLNLGSHIRPLGDA